MPKKKAFTLVELLVVIAIIALLIAILAPSLQNARLMAKQMMCGQNLRSIGSAIQTYAAANRDYVPPFANNQDKRDEVLSVGSEIWALASAFRYQKLDSYDENAPYCLGFLYNERSSSDSPSTLYVDDWHIFYCPGQPREEPDLKKVVGYWASWYEEYMAEYNTSWKETVTGFADTVYTSFTYNPNITIAGKHRYPKIDQFPAESVLAMDIVLSGPKFVAHWLSAPAWNVCFADSHVENVLSPQLEGRFQVYKDASMNPEAFTKLMAFLMYGVDTN